MKTSRIVRVACLSAAAVLLTIAAWAILWLFSSYSMAFSACNGTFSLSAVDVRCRQPQLAMMLCALSLLLGAMLGIFALKAGK